MKLAVIASAVACACAGCGTSQRPEVFGFVGEVRDYQANASVISLWYVPSPAPGHYYKFGDGSTVLNQFDISYKALPPELALDAGLGVGLLALLPGLSTLPEGDVASQSQLRLAGISSGHAVIYRADNAVGPAWSQAFPVGFSCGECQRGTPPALDTFTPVVCDRVVIQVPLTHQCAFY